jgi:hypothetical protein
MAPRTWAPPPETDLRFIRKHIKHSWVEGKIVKIAIPVMLLATILVGCTSGVRQRYDTNKPSPTQPGQSEMQQTPEITKKEPLEPETVFPNIKPMHHADNLRWIEAYCRQRGIRQLAKDHIRLFVQPMGYVDGAIEIDLIHRQMTVYPGTHSKKEIVQITLNEEQTAEIRALVTSEEFKKIPAENEKWGMDGFSYLVETYIDNVYSWKLHWVPEDKELIRVVEHIQSSAGKKVPNKTQQRTSQTSESYR